MEKRYVIQMTTPEGVIKWIPKKYGHGVHELTTKLEDAWEFDTKEKAQRNLISTTNPPAFWPSEIEHREGMRKRYERWNCGVIELTHREDN